MNIDYDDIFIFTTSQLVDAYKRNLDRRAKEAPMAINHLVHLREFFSSPEAGKLKSSAARPQVIAAEPELDDAGQLI